MRHSRKQNKTGPSIFPRGSHYLSHNISAWDVNHVTITPVFVYSFHFFFPFAVWALTLSSLCRGRATQQSILVPVFCKWTMKTLQLLTNVSLHWHFFLLLAGQECHTSWWLQQTQTVKLRKYIYIYMYINSNVSIRMETQIQIIILGII